MPVLLEKESEVVASSRLCEWGTSRAVRIPRKMCDATGIATGDSLDVRSGVDAEGAFIVIRPAAKEHRSYGAAPCISMEDAFRDYDGGYVPTEFDWGCDVGAEVVE